MGCLIRRIVQYVEKGRPMASPVRTVFELTGLESGGNDEHWIVATAIPIFRLGCRQTRWGRGTRSNIGGEIAGSEIQPPT
jgi:hypothetical protein